MKWMLLPLHRYADFQGRSRRLEYWMFTLFVTLCAMALGALVLVFAGLGSSEPSGFTGTLIVILGLAYLAILVPSIAVQVRRFHDRDMSGWFVLLNFIPYVGSLIVFVFMVLDGTPGPNRYGPDPKDPEGIQNLGEVFG